MAYFNLDSVSSSTCTTFDLHTTCKMEQFAIEFVEKKCGLKLTSCNLFGRTNIAQDSAPFFQNGVESIWLQEEGNPHFHTPQDTTEKVDIDRLTKISSAIWTMCAYLVAGGKI